MTAQEPVTYQVTINGKVVAEFTNGYDAREHAGKIFTRRIARGKVISVRRSDGEPVTARAVAAERPATIPLGTV